MEIRIGVSSLLPPPSMPTLASGKAATSPESYCANRLRVGTQISALRRSILQRQLCYESLAATGRHFYSADLPAFFHAPNASFWRR